MYLEGLPWRKIIFNLLIIPVFALFLSTPPAWSKRDHITHFPNTAYELNIYKIYGKKPGKTLMLIGGIQGNEPGGFLSADLYTDMSLEKGNMIVVPRANFYSIILNQRGPHGDMNRKFTPENTSDSMEDKIVSILKVLISESDYLLNLHDGAGYYYPKYINKWRNPMRFGQSIIADTDEYKHPGTGRVIRLREMAEKVLRDVNPHIQNDLYKFHFMNTRTPDKKSSHKEQRRSATYYALTKHHIPAFGVETSKFLPSVDLKVRYHNLVINAFKKLFGIIPESPRMVLDPPVLKYLVVSKNNQTPIVIKNGEPFELDTGDSINVTHIEANYERGLSLDILGYGDLNDYRQDFTISRNTTILVRKDNHNFAEIPIKVSRRKSAPIVKADANKRLEGFVIKTKGQRVFIANGETLQLVKGDKMRIMDILPRRPRSSGIKVNFKGFVGDLKHNTGEDRGYTIDTGADLMKRYSLNKKGKVYKIIVTKGKRNIGRMMVKLKAPKMDYLILRVNGHKHLYIKPEDRVSLSPNDEISLEEIRTNLYSEKDIRLHINGRRLKAGQVTKVKDIYSSSDGVHHLVKVQRGHLLLGRLFFRTNE